MEMYTKGYKFRLYPNTTQSNLINRTLGSCRFVYNHFLAVRKEEWQENKTSITYMKSSSLLTKLKAEEDTKWLKEVDSMALQESLKNLDNAYQGFFKKRAKYPKFKSKHNRNQSYRTRNQGNGIRMEGKRIKLPKVGWVRIELSQEIQGNILNATICRKASGKYYISLCVEQDMETLLKSNAGGEVGIDVGVKDFYTDSHGNTVDNPSPLKRLSRKLVREQRRLSRKKLGSKNREKANIRVACVHEKIAHIRLDFLHKLSTKLVKENELVAIENLNIKGMMKNHTLAKSIADVSWGEFFRQLSYKAVLYGTIIKKVDTFYPSSQICHVCGEKNPFVKNLAVREWDCPQCHTHHHRDENAAKNILRQAKTA